MSHTHTVYGSKVIVVPNRERRVSGGTLVTVELTEDNPNITLKDGSTHPMHRKGYRWETPRENLQPV